MEKKKEYIDYLYVLSKYFNNNDYRKIEESKIIIGIFRDLVFGIELEDKISIFEQFVNSGAYFEINKIDSNSSKETVSNVYSKAISCCTQNGISYEESEKICKAAITVLASTQDSDIFRGDSSYNSTQSEASRDAKKSKKSNTHTIFLLIIIGLLTVLFGKQYFDKQADSTKNETKQSISIVRKSEDNTPNSTAKSAIFEKQYNVGDYITFGSYEQDNNTANGKEDIKWLVLDKQDDKILVISQVALDAKAYNSSYASVTWETCSLRSWLNATFFNNAFNPNEQSMIKSTLVRADKNPRSDESSGNNTTDKVFLLSIKEANDYFSTDVARRCIGSAYCYAQGAYQADNCNCEWWLRSPGNGSYGAAYVRSDGSVLYNGDLVNFDCYAVRPAIWINLGF